jgi:hypothetical protein
MISTVVSNGTLLKLPQGFDIGNTSTEEVAVNFNQFPREFYSVGRCTKNAAGFYNRGIYWVPTPGEGPGG